MKATTHMRMSDLVDRSGIPRTTIHFYLRQGILHPPVKTGRTMAYYDDSHLRRLLAIKKIKMGTRVPVAFLRERLKEMEEGESAQPSAPDPSGEVDSRNPKNRRRQEIIEAAIRVFSDKGFHRAKIQDITSALGISTGTFYIYFPNKRELFIEVVDDIFRTIVDQAAASIRGEKDLRTRLFLRGKVFFENYTKYAEILHQLRAEIAGEDPWPQEKIKKIYHGLTEPVIRDLRKAMEQGQIRELDPDLLAYALTGLIEIMSFRVTLDQKYSFIAVD